MFYRGHTGQADSRLEFALWTIVASRVDRCDDGQALDFAGFWECESVMAAVAQKAWQAPRGAGINRRHAIGEGST